MVQVITSHYVTISLMSTASYLCFCLFLKKKKAKKNKTKKHPFHIEILKCDLIRIISSVNIILL